MNILRWLFDDSVFTTRNHCGSGWTDLLILINQFGNLLFVVAYFSIGISLMMFYFKLIKYPAYANYNIWIVWMFGAFITLCGSTHLADIVVFYYAGYRFYTLIDLLAGIVSLTTAVTLPRFLRMIKTNNLNNNIDATTQNQAS